MANIFKAKSSTSKPCMTNEWVGKHMRVVINSLEHSGMGVVSDHRPVIFVEGALPGETVDIVIKEQKARFCRAELISILDASPDRAEPFCPHFRLCGGCQTQHINPSSACSLKQSAIEQLILHTPLVVAKNTSSQRKKGSLSRKGSKTGAIRTINDLIDTLPWCSSISSEALGYRRKTRLSLDARNRQDIRLGYRKSASKQIFSLQQCRVLTPGLQSLIKPLQRVMESLQNPSAIGHVSMFEGNNGSHVCFRVVKSLSQKDKTKLIEFAKVNNVQLAFEDNQHQIALTNAEHVPLVFNVTNDIELTADINDFVQVNDNVNKKMIDQACDWLDLGADDRVLDLFCGIGNFSLPLATKCQYVLGIEGVAKMVQSAKQNALKHDILNCDFKHVDLSRNHSLASQDVSEFNKVLLDPAREGASVAIDMLIQSKPSHILYVSCNPATFARDAAKLLEYKYRMDKIGLMDMFPQTAHTELMALFVPNH